MLVADVETRWTEIALRQEAHYWRALHARAVEREAAWKERAEQLERIVRDPAAQIAELTGENEALKARVAWLAQQVFGRKSEQAQGVTLEAHDGDGDVAAGPKLLLRSDVNMATGANALGSPRHPIRRNPYHFPPAPWANCDGVPWIRPRTRHYGTNSSNAITTWATSPCPAHKYDT